jgi:hypothetical protein
MHVVLVVVVEFCLCFEHDVFCILLSCFISYVREEMYMRAMYIFDCFILMMTLLDMSI